MSSNFKTATDFRKSLEKRLQAEAVIIGEDLQRLRRKVAFDRLLARIFSQNPSDFFLKGGYAMELRVSEARATTDIDLTAVRSTETQHDSLEDGTLSKLQKLARIDLQDYFMYQIGQAKLELENAPYGGLRYPVSSFIDRKLFVSFKLDVGMDIIAGGCEQIQGLDWLHFCGISPPTISMISIEQQFAEKIHAYSLPRKKNPNSRVKDLIDLVLLLKIREPQKEAFIRALQRVFKSRKKHDLPKNLSAPPDQWRTVYEALAEECGIHPNMEKGFKDVARFYNRLDLTSS